MTPEFNEWWDSELIPTDNPYSRDSPAFWAYEGWQAGARAEREACAKVGGASASNVEIGVPPAVVNVSRQRLERNLEGFAELMVEAANILERMPREVFDSLKVRFHLCDELEGSALMARDAAPELRLT